MLDFCDKHGPYSVICRQCDLEESSANSDYFAEQLYLSKKRESVLVKALTRCPQYITLAIIVGQKTGLSQQTMDIARRDMQAVTNALTGATLSTVSDIAEKE